MSMRKKLAVWLSLSVIGWVAVVGAAYGVALTADFVWSAIQ